MNKNFAELFAGVGLINEGLAADNWQCAWANDISVNKRETYVANFGEKGFHCADIWDCVVTPDIIPNPCFLYTASFPCTDLSLAGARKGLAGAKSGTLHALLDILRKKKQKSNLPNMVMLENVQGFLTSNNGSDISFTVKALNDLGYIVDLIELDAIYFSPQSRPRVFLFALNANNAKNSMLIKTVENESSWWSVYEKNPHLRTKRIRTIINANPSFAWGMFDIPSPPIRKNTLADIIEIDMMDNSDYWWDEKRKAHLYHQMFQRHQEIVAQMQSNDFYSYGTVFRRMRDKISRAELRADGVAGCLRTPSGGSSKQILIRAGFGTWNVRLLTPREYARLQGVRDSFLLPKNDNQAYLAMADAVCVPAIRFLSKHVLIPSYNQSMKNLPIQASVE